MGDKQTKKQTNKNNKTPNQQTNKKPSKITNQNLPNPPPLKKPKQKPKELQKRNGTITHLQIICPDLTVNFTRTHTSLTSNNTAQHSKDEYKPQGFLGSSYLVLILFPVLSKATSTGISSSRGQWYKNITEIMC